MRQLTAEAKQPLGCTYAEIAAFCCFVRQGGEVEPQGLEGRARRSRSLIFLYFDSVLVGVAALKRPTVAYRDAAFRGAQVSKEASRFRLELGWVYVPPEHRKKGYSRIVANAAMAQADGASAFATTRLDNTAMQRTLQHLGFARLGGSWKSKRGEHELVLYVGPPNKRLQPSASGERVSRRG